MVAPLSTSVPSQSKIASLFATRGQFLNRGNDVLAPGLALTFGRRRQVFVALVLVEFARSAHRGRQNLEADDRLDHCLELARPHLGSRPRLLRRIAALHGFRELVEESDQLLFRYAPRDALNLDRLIM